MVEGPVEYFKIANAPGLTYSSIAWGDPNAYENYPRILPGVFLKYKLPENYQDLTVSLVEGPDWCFQDYDVVTLDSDNNYLLSNITMIKFLLKDGQFETADKVTLKLTWR